MARGILYKMGLSTPFLRCLEKAEADYALLEIHEGIVWKNLGASMLTKKVLRAGYFWPTMA